MFCFPTHILDLSSVEEEDASLSFEYTEEASRFSQQGFMSAASSVSSRAGGDDMTFMTAEQKTAEQKDDSEFFTKLDYLSAELKQELNKSLLKANGPPSLVNVPSTSKRLKVHKKITPTKAKINTMRSTKAKSKDAALKVPDQSVALQDSELSFENLCARYDLEKTQIRLSQFQDDIGTDDSAKYIDDLVKYWMFEEWCKFNQKKPELKKFQTWIINFQFEQSRYNGLGRLTHKNISMYADLTFDEYKSLTSTGKSTIILSILHHLNLTCDFQKKHLVRALARYGLVMLSRIRASTARASLPLLSRMFQKVMSKMSRQCLSLHTQYDYVNSNPSLHRPSKMDYCYKLVVLVF